MRVINALTRAATPVAMVYGANWRSVPRWVGGIFGSKRAAAALVQRKATLPPAPEPCDQVPGDPDDCAEQAASEAFESSGDAHSLVEEMLARGRFALLLRPQLIANLSPEQLARARAALSEGMCLVPAGEVIVYRTRGTSESDPDSPARPEAPVWVDGYYVDRCQVTNAEYYQFVRHGGYEQMGIWDPEVLPAVLDFVDATGHPGPRFWRDGKYPRGEGHHPVVGVCWYEASAYARWVGKRLATDAEWTKSASWPVAIAGQPLLQRRYPWGEAVDRTRANLWGSGPGRTVPVDEFSSGVSVGGVQQLIGNVWEWTADSLRLEPDDDLPPDTPTRKMRSLRGGAYDTYLDCQATCTFQSGDDVLARKHNIGFRCAISLCDFANFNADDEAPAEENDSDSFVESDV